MKDAEKKYSIGKLELLAERWGLERFRLYLHGKQVQLFSDHQALETLLKKNKTNKQNSARPTRLLDRLNNFDITLQYTAGKQIKFTDFLGCNPTENEEQEENYEEEFVIKDIAQLVTVKCRIGRVVNQSESAKVEETADMLDTHAQTGTRCRKTNKSYSHSTSTANQIAINTLSDTLLQANMDSFNNNLQNPYKISSNSDRYTRESSIKYHRGADDEIMRIVNKRDNSPKTSDG